MYTNIIGGDSETFHGKPITFQFHYKTGSGGVKQDIIWIDNPKKSTLKFLSALDSIAKTHNRDTQHIVYVHNLEFDLVSFFFDRHKEFYDNPQFEFTIYGWRVSGVYGHPTFCRLSRINSRHSFFIVDSFSWFQTSLAKLAELICPDLPKLKRPNGLGEKKFFPSDKGFCAYALRDPEISYQAGLIIEQWHRDYDIPQCVSSPHMAAKIFRKHFLKKPIPLPSMKVVYSALSSYHGGKNNVTVPAGWYKDIYSVDISSAFPYAMSLLPSFSNPDLYKYIEGKGNIKKVPDLGIYKIFGLVKACKWPSLYDHKFNKLSGAVSGVWVTGWELNEAIRSKEIKLEKLEGYFYEASKDKEPSPFAAYVNHFYEKKENAQDKIYRTFYKLMLNSLYGKFIQARKTATMHSELSYDIDNDRLYSELSLVAGGLFNPFIATLITGHTRAYIHRIEHKYNALHTATDGIFATKKPILKRTKLGGLTVDSEGDLILVRNKLYVIYSDKPRDKDKPIESTVFNKYVQKYALHGFHGKLPDLEHLLITGKRSYNYTRMNKLRESVRRGLSVNKFESRTSTLNLKEDI